MEKFSYCSVQVSLNEVPFIMDSQSDSDSKDDSVIESLTVNTVKFVDDHDSKDKGMDSIQKKEKFKSFYHIQKTICVESNSSSMDVEGQDLMKETEEVSEEDVDNPKLLFEEVLEDLALPTIPKIKMKRLLKKKEECQLSDDDSTDHSELHMNEKDKEEILKNHEKPNIVTKFEPCLSHVTQKNVDDKTMDCLEVGGDTSEDEVSEIIPDPTNLPKPVENSPKIQHPKIKRSMTQESDIIVSDLDYYKIRHETDVDDGTEFFLLSTYQPSSRTKCKSNGNIQCSIPYIKIVEISGNAYDQDENVTSDEDVPCTEADFMSKTEFIEAHRSNMDLTRKESRLKISHSIAEKSDTESDEESTESLRENLEIDSDESLSLTNLEMDCEESLTDHSPDCASVNKIQHSNDCKFMNFIKSFDTYNNEELDIVDEEPESFPKNIDDYEDTNARTDEEDYSDSDTEIKNQENGKSVNKSKRKATKQRNTKKL